MASFDWAKTYDKFVRGIVAELLLLPPESLDLTVILRETLHARAIYGEQLGTSFAIHDTVARIHRLTAQENAHAEGHEQGVAGGGAVA